MMGWSFDAIPFRIIEISRARRLARIRLPRNVDLRCVIGDDNPHCKHILAFDLRKDSKRAESRGERSFRAGLKGRNYRRANGVYTVSATLPKGIRVLAVLRTVSLFAALLLNAVLSAQTQPCSFSVSPTSATFGASGGDGLITLTASASGCTREVTSSVPWVTITFGQTGTGNGTASYRVQVNNTTSQRTGTLSVAGQVFTI